MPYLTAALPGKYFIFSANFRLYLFSKAKASDTHSFLKKFNHIVKYKLLTLILTFVDTSYFSNISKFDLLSCAPDNICLLASDKIIDLVNFAISVEKSVSIMRPIAASVITDWLLRLLIDALNLFCNAPIKASWFEIVSKTLSVRAIAAAAPACVDTSALASVPELELELEPL